MANLGAALKPLTIPDGLDLLSASVVSTFTPVAYDTALLPDFEVIEVPAPPPNSGQLFPR